MSDGDLRQLQILQAALAHVVNLSTSLADLKKLRDAVAGSYQTPGFTYILHESKVVELLAQAFEFAGGDSATLRMRLLLEIVTTVAECDVSPLSNECFESPFNEPGCNVLALTNIVDRAKMFFCHQSEYEPLSGLLLRFVCTYANSPILTAVARHAMVGYILDYMQEDHLRDPTSIRNDDHITDFCDRVVALCSRGAPAPSALMAGYVPMLRAALQRHAVGSEAQFEVRLTVYGALCAVFASGSDDVTDFTFSAEFKRVLDDVQRYDALFQRSYSSFDLLDICLRALNDNTFDTVFNSERISAFFELVNGSRHFWSRKVLVPLSGILARLAGRFP